MSVERVEQVYEDAIRHALLRLERGEVEECKRFLHECIKRFPRTETSPQNSAGTSE